MVADFAGADLRSRAEKSASLFKIQELGLIPLSSLGEVEIRIYVREFAYCFAQGGKNYRFGMKLKDKGIENGRGDYDLMTMDTA